MTRDWPRPSDAEAAEDEEAHHQPGVAAAKAPGKVRIKRGIWPKGNVLAVVLAGGESGGE